MCTARTGARETWFVCVDQFPMLPSALAWTPPIVPHVIISLTIREEECRW